MSYAVVSNVPTENPQKQGGARLCMKVMSAVAEIVKKLGMRIEKRIIQMPGYGDIEFLFMNSEQRQQFFTEVDEFHEGRHDLNKRVVHNSEMRRENIRRLDTIIEMSKKLNIDRDTLFTEDTKALLREHAKKLTWNKQSKIYKRYPTKRTIGGHREDLRQYNRELDRRADIRPEMFKRLCEIIELLKEEEKKRLHAGTAAAAL